MIDYPLPFFHAQNEVKGGRMQEVVENIALEKLKPFPNHPFKIREDEAMMETVESVKSVRCDCETYKGRLL